jgi:flagellar motor switch protein FliG
MTAVMSDTGVRKAAVLLVQLGQERAAQIFSHLRDGEVEAISAEISRLDSLDVDETESVLNEFRELAVARAHIAQGGPDFAKNLLEQVLGQDRAQAIMDRLSAASMKLPFQFLYRADPRQLLSFISE